MDNPRISPSRAVTSTDGQSSWPAPADSVEERVRRAFADREQEIEEISRSNPELALRMKTDLDQLRLSIITAIHDARSKAEKQAASSEK